VGETGAGDASVPKLAVGGTPNLAARVQGLAGADQIVIASTARRLVGGVFALADILRGDVVRAVADVPVYDKKTFEQAVLEAAGQTVSLSLVRDGISIKKDITLNPRPH